MRERVRSWVGRWPVVFGAVATGAWCGLILALAELPPHPFWGPVYINGLAFLVGMALVGLLGWARGVGLGHLRGGLSAIPLVLLSCTEAWPGLGSSFDKAVILVCVGLNEELWSRGIILTALRRLGPYRCASWVAVLFGLQHLINLRWGQSFDDTAVQIIEAAGFGFALAALRMRGVSIWWLMLYHAFADYLSIMSPGSAPGWQQAAEVVIEVGYGLWILRTLPRDGETRPTWDPQQPASTAPGRDDHET